MSVFNFRFDSEDGGSKLLQYPVNFCKTASHHVVKDVKISVLTLASFTAKHIFVVCSAIYYFIVQKCDWFIRNISKLASRIITLFVPPEIFLYDSLRNFYPTPDMFCVSSVNV